MIAPEDACVSIPYQRWRDGTTDSGSDEIVIEEPVEYQIDGKPVATVMRTPGHDRDLAIGFFFCEGWISAKSDVGALRLCESPTADGDATRTESSDANVVDLIPSADANLRPVETTRALPVTASCGVCGKSVYFAEQAILRSLLFPLLSSAHLRCSSSSSGCR